MVLGDKPLEGVRARYYDDRVTGLSEMPKVGECVRYLGGDSDNYGNLTEGRIYEVTSVDSDGDAEIIDNAGDSWYLLPGDDFGYYELVEEAEPQPDLACLTNTQRNRGDNMTKVTVPREVAEAIDL